MDSNVKKAVEETLIGLAKEQKQENQSDEKVEEKVVKEVQDRQPKALMITLGINGDKTPLKVVSTSEDGNVSTDDVLTALATIEVNNFVMLAQRATITNNSGADVMATYEYMEDMKADMVSRTILNIVRSQVQLSTHPVWREILQVINANAEANLKLMEAAKNQTTSGIVLPS